MDAALEALSGSTLAQYLRTRSSHAFNWIDLNLGSGVHEVEDVLTADVDAALHLGGADEAQVTPLNTRWEILRTRPDNGACRTSSCTLPCAPASRPWSWTPRGT